MAKSSTSRSWRFVIGFFLGVCAFTLLIRIPWVDENVVLPYTSWITSLSASILSALGLDVVSEGTFIMHQGGFAVNIRKGCDGLVASMILVSATLAYPFRWINRLTGVALGFLLIFILNLIRILVLFWLGVADFTWLFDLVHTYVSQFIVIALSMVFWVYWAGRERTPAW